MLEELDACRSLTIRQRAPAHGHHPVRPMGLPPGDVIEPRSAQLSPVASPVRMLTARTSLGCVNTAPTGVIRGLTGRWWLKLGELAIEQGYR
jgi:hypothetical protein